MQIKVNKSNLLFSIVCIYFASKMLWDQLFPGVIEILSLCIILWGSFSLLIQNKRGQSINVLITIYICLCGYVICAALFKDTTDQIMRAIYEYCFYNIIIFSMIYYQKRITFNSIARTLVIFGCVIAILSWYEYFTKSYIIGTFRSTINNYYGFRAAVFTRSYLSHGIILGLFSILAYYKFLDSKRKWYIFSCVFLYISILTTSSRGPLVACTLGLLIMWFVNYYSNNRNIKKRLYIIFLLVLVLYIALMFLQSSFLTGNPTIDYFLFRMRQILNWTGDAGNVGRISIWKETMEMFFSSPWFGIGPSKTGSWGAGSIGVTESGVLKHLCELGIMGFAIYYIFIGVVIKIGIKNYKQSINKDKSLYLCFFGIITMIMVNNITLQSTEEIMISFFYWMAMGGLVSLPYLKSQNGVKVQRKK